MTSKKLGPLTAVAVVILSSCAMVDSSSSRQPGPEQVFETPESAVDSLIAANRADDDATVLKILGPKGKTLITSGDPVADKNGRHKFVAAYDAAHKINNENAYKDILVVGTEEWPLPIPLVHVSTGWQFDTGAGVDEILNRRIGHNELNVIQVCNAYVDAQEDYAALHKGAYAQRLLSLPGKHDGLYWPVKSGEPESPFGQLIADANAEGYAINHGHHAPYHGYYFKILKSQGSSAAGGMKDYVVNGRMTGGFALLAFPAKYGDSGIVTFVVDQNGIIYQKNLGPDTSVLAEKITSFDPDPTWKVTDAEKLLSSED